MVAGGICSQVVFERLFSIRGEFFPVWCDFRLVFCSKTRKITPVRQFSGRKSNLPPMSGM
jgi:hypothetical protein